MEDDTERKARSGANRAHAVPHVHSVIASASFDGTVACRKDHDFPLRRGQNLCARLRPRPLFDEQKLTAGKIAVRPAEKSGELQRKGQGSINILMKAVVIPGT